MEFGVQIAKICPGSLIADEAQTAEMDTGIRKLTWDEHGRLYWHWFEVADGFRYADYSEDFDYIGLKEIANATYLNLQACKP